MNIEIHRQPSMFLGGWKTVIAVPTILFAIVGWSSSFLIEPPDRARAGLVFSQRSHGDNDQILELLDFARQMKEMFTSDRLYLTLVGGIAGFFIGVSVLSSFGRSGHRRRSRRASTHRSRT